LEDQGLGKLLINECIKATIEEWGTLFKDTLKESLRETKRHPFQETKRD
jgi:hypothetical protein